MGEAKSARFSVTAITILSALGLGRELLEGDVLLALHADARRLGGDRLLDAARRRALELAPVLGAQTLLVAAAVAALPVRARWFGVGVAAVLARLV